MLKTLLAFQENYSVIMIRREIFVQAFGGSVDLALFQKNERGGKMRGMFQDEKRGNKRGIQFSSRRGKMRGIARDEKWRKQRGMRFSSRWEKRRGVAHNKKEEKKGEMFSVRMGK